MSDFLFTDVEDELPTDAKQTDYIFTYGTLRRSSPTGAHKEYLHDSDFISPAKIRGQLFLVDYYPGVIASEADEWVQGEIYLLRTHKQLHQLDVYEGCASNSPQPHEYERTIIDALLPNGDLLKTWVYIYLGNTHRLTRIESGDFLQP